MENNTFLKNLIAALVCCMAFIGASAQSRDGWYKVFKGKMGNYTATLHLHKTVKNYSGYLWFLENQWPMQLYYNTTSKKTDSLVMSANSGPMGIIISGILLGDRFSGLSELTMENKTPRQATFELQETKEPAFTPFSYYYTEGFAKLSPSHKNESECNYVASGIWPESNGSMQQLYKQEIRELLGMKTPVEQMGSWLIDEKNRVVSAWKKETGKYSPRETADLGLSLSKQEEIRALVLYENETYITLARYNAGYNGGAHGNFSTLLSTFNKKSGKKLQLSDLITPAGIQVLPGLLDKVARLQYSINNKKPLDQNGFLVKRIQPNQNFYITDNGIGFFYAPYAIKSFADGEINLLVPFTAVKPYLKKTTAAK